MEKYVLAIDQGTTSTRAIIFNRKSDLIATSQMEFTQIHPHNGWVEHDGEEILETVWGVVKNVINKSGLSLRDISAIGITNQRETTIMWDKETGKPVYNAIVWQSRQSQAICDDLIKQGYQKLFQEKTGLLINPYFSLSKIKWILDNVKGARELANKNRLLFGTIDTYLAWHLSKGKLHITDASNASRTMLYNIKENKWDEEILEIVGIPKSILPEVRNTSEVYGYVKFEEIDKDYEIPLASIVGDQQASLFGQCCFTEGEIKNTYGTGCFMLMNTQDKLVYSNTGLLSTIAWQINGKVEYALEGSVFVSGSAVQWLRDGLRFFRKSSDCENYLSRDNNSNGVYFVPAFVGLGTPYWDNDARGAIFGLTRATSKENIIAATIEAIAYQSKDVMEVMQQEAKVKIKHLAVDGGASINDYLMQFQANILNTKIIRPKCLETTALGAAYLAGLAVGVWKDKEEIKKMRSIEKIFTNKINDEVRYNLYRGWKIAVEATRHFKL
ncbi:MAG TPA: glycerol kinase GlpK [Acholeplasmataceae bacterium]|nr:glycerol kinase GlpK [Acholeplasmataceae bacterium]